MNLRKLREMAERDADSSAPQLDEVLAKIEMQKMHLAKIMKNNPGIYLEIIRNGYLFASNFFALLCNYSTEEGNKENGLKNFYESIENFASQVPDSLKKVQNVYKESE